MYRINESRYAMRKIFDKKTIITFIISGILFGSIGVYAASYYAKDIYYQPSDASWDVSNVNDAINKLYDMKTELNNIKDIGDAEASDIIEGKTAVVKGNAITGTMKGNSIEDLKEAQCGQFNYTGSAVNVKFKNEFKSTPDRVFMWGYPTSPYLYFITLGASATTTGFSAQHLYTWNGGSGENQRWASFSGTVYYCAFVYNN